MIKVADRFFSWVWSLLLALLAAFSDNADAVGFAIILAAALVVADYITGIAASLYEGKGIVSKRMRWSFAKLTIYIITIIGTMFIGVLLHLIQVIIEPETTKTSVLIATLTILKFEAYVIAWIELLSNIENALRIFPKNIFLKFLHWILSVEAVKKIPKLAEFLKEKGEK